MKKILLLLFLISLFSISFVKVNAMDELCSNSKSAILIEESSGKILYNKNEYEKLSMASMTKVMTLIIIFDNINNNTINYETKFTTSENAKGMGGSQAYLETGEVHTLDELLRCICIASANDASVTVAEGIAGSESEFVKMMNEKAVSLGLNNTLFSDCTGLSNENHYTCAYDMAFMSKYLINNYPSVLKYSSMKESYIRENEKNPFWLVNTNKLIGYNNIDGLKTGWTVKAKYCITVTSKKNNMRLIAVGMGYDNTKLRNKELVELLNYGYSNYEMVQILKKDTIIKNVKDIRLKPSTFDIIIEKDIYIPIKKGEDINNIEISYEYEENYNNHNLGKALIIKDDNVINEVSIIVNKRVRKKKIYELYLDLLKEIT